MVSSSLVALDILLSLMDSVPVRSWELPYIVRNKINNYYIYKTKRLCFKLNKCNVDHIKEKYFFVHYTILSECSNSFETPMEDADFKSISESCYSKKKHA